MRVSEAGGEDAIVRLVREKHGVCAGGDLALGIGDDAALIRAGDRLLIVTTDILVENTHFRMDLITPYLLGWKAVAVNLSDVAAMGGVPTYTFVSIGLPDVDVSAVEGIYQGMRDVCDKYGSAIAGGDTVASGAGMVISVTQLGWVETGRAALRSGAKVGDQLIVTGTLGDSVAGLELLLRGEGEPPPSPLPLGGGEGFLVERHLRPEPRVKEARAAVETGKVHAMMDLSDGLSMDLARMCEASGVGARILADQLPVSQELRRAAKKLGRDPIELAAGGGEDYELLIACDQSDSREVCRKIGAAGTPACVIGHIVAGTGVALVSRNGDRPMPSSWEHF